MQPLYRGTQGSGSREHRDDKQTFIKSWGDFDQQYPRLSFEGFQTVLLVLWLII